MVIHINPLCFVLYTHVFCGEFRVCELDISFDLFFYYAMQFILTLYIM